MKEPKVVVSSNKNGMIVLADIGVGGERGLIFDCCGISPTLSATQYKDPVKVVIGVQNNGRTLKSR